jgi:hypothetical protein
MCIVPRMPTQVSEVFNSIWETDEEAWAIYKSKCKNIRVYKMGIITKEE